MLETPLRQEQRKRLGTEQNPEDSSKIVLSEEVLLLRIDHTDDSGKIILVFIWEDG
jgi:hypothetical protein